MSATRIEIDREACSGAGECTRHAPRTFSLDDARKAVAADPPGDPDEAVQTAVRACPNFAIELVD